LPGRKKFIIKAQDLSEKNIFIQCVILNIKQWNNPYFSYNERKRRGTGFFISPKPNKKLEKQVDLIALNTLVGNE